MEFRLRHRPAELSGGQRQRVAAAERRRADRIFLAEGSIAGGLHRPTADAVPDGMKEFDARGRTR